MIDSEFIKVAIVDDHKMIVDGLERLINESEIARVVGMAYSGAECMQLLKSNQPEVLLLDIGLPDINGIELCSKIKACYPQVKIMMLTSYGELASISRALDAGADGYVLKNSSQESVQSHQANVSYAKMQRPPCRRVKQTCWCSRAVKWNYCN